VRLIEVNQSEFYSYKTPVFRLSTHSSMASSGGPYSAPAQPPTYQHNTSHTSEGWAAINAEAALTDDPSMTPSAYLPRPRAYCFPAIRYDPDDDAMTVSRIHRKIGAILNEHADGVDGLPGSAFSAAPTHYHVDSLGRVPAHLTNATLDEEEAVNFHNMRLANGADPAIFPPDSVICNRLVDTLIMALLNDRVGIEGGLEHCCCISKEAVAPPPPRLQHLPEGPSPAGRRASSSTSTTASPVSALPTPLHIAASWKGLPTTTGTLRSKPSSPSTRQPCSPSAGSP